MEMHPGSSATTCAREGATPWQQLRVDIHSCSLRSIMYLWAHKRSQSSKWATGSKSKATSPDKGRDANADSISDVNLFFTSASPPPSLAQGLLRRQHDPAQSQLPQEKNTQPKHTPSCICGCLQDTAAAHCSFYSTSQASFQKLFPQPFCIAWPNYEFADSTQQALCELLEHAQPPHLHLPANCTYQRSLIWKKRASNKGMRLVCVFMKHVAPPYDCAKIKDCHLGQTTLSNENANNNAVPRRSRLQRHVFS